MNRKFEIWTFDRHRGGFSFTQSIEELIECEKSAEKNVRKERRKTTSIGYGALPRHMYDVRRKQNLSKAGSIT
jgi:hypothetical protein